MSRLKGGANGVALLTEQEASEWVGWLEPFCEVATDLFLVQQAIKTLGVTASLIATRRFWPPRSAPLRLSFYSEDLGHGQSYGDVQVINPFLK